MHQELLCRKRIFFEETGNERGWLVEAAIRLQFGSLGRGPRVSGRRIRGKNAGGGWICEGNELILTGAGPGVGGEEYSEKKDNDLATKDGRDVVSSPLGGEGLETGTAFSDGGLGLRGRGGGMTGMPSYASSTSVGIGVVRALGKGHRQSIIYIDLSLG